MQTRAQRDAIKALEQVKAVSHSDDKELKTRYAVLAYRFPIMVRQNGLQQALGFIQGKSGLDIKSAESWFLNHVAGVLQIPADNIIETVMGASLKQYCYYTRRCLEASIWYRRFAESVLKIDATGQPLEDQQ